jgi:hypothetical protein
MHERTRTRTLRMSLATLIEKMQLTLAARRYARRLGPQLRRDYGGGREYTAAQIRTAAQKCRLPARHRKLGYAAFMTEDAFRTVAAAPDWPDYASLRAIYLAWVPRHSYAQTNAPENPYIGAAGSSL